MKKKLKAKKDVSKHMPPVPEVTQPAWVREMHLFYQRRGFYRPQDLQKVLGDARGHVEIEVSPNLEFAFRNAKKTA